MKKFKKVVDQIHKTTCKRH